MKRDIELIRKILEDIENSLSPCYSGKINIDGYDDQSIAFHIDLLIEAGYVKGIADMAESGQYVIAYPERLTWQGYEFLELTRNEGAWNKAKSFLKEKSINLPFSILTELLQEYVKSVAGLKS